MILLVVCLLCMYDDDGISSYIHANPNPKPSQKKKKSKNERLTTPPKPPPPSKKAGIIQHRHRSGENASAESLPSSVVFIA